MNIMIRGIASWSGGRRLVVLLPVFVALLWLISFSPFWFSEASIKADYGTGTLDLQFGSHATQAITTLDRLGKSGRSAYDAFQVVDLLFPASYALALAGLIWAGWGGARQRWVIILAAVPMFGACLDYLENLLVRVALSTYPDVPTNLLTVSTTVTTLKLSLSYLSQVLAVVAIGLVVYRAFPNRTRRRVA